MQNEHHWCKFYIDVGCKHNFHLHCILCTNGAQKDRESSNSCCNEYITLQCILSTDEAQNDIFYLNTNHFGYFKLNGWDYYFPSIITLSFHAFEATTVCKQCNILHCILSISGSQNNIVFWAQYTPRYSDLLVVSIFFAHIINTIAFDEDSRCYRRAIIELLWVCSRCSFRVPLSRPKSFVQAYTISSCAGHTTKTSCSSLPFFAASVLWPCSSVLCLQKGLHQIVKDVSSFSSLFPIFSIAISVASFC